MFPVDKVLLYSFTVIYKEYVLVTGYVLRRKFKIVNSCLDSKFVSGTSLGQGHSGRKVAIVLWQLVKFCILLHGLICAVSGLLVED